MAAAVAEGDTTPCAPSADTLTYAHRSGSALQARNEELARRAAAVSKADTNAIRAECKALHRLGGLSGSSPKLRHMPRRRAMRSWRARRRRLARRTWTRCARSVRRAWARPSARCTR